MTAIRSALQSPMRAGLRSPYPATTSRAQTLDADALYRGPTLDADFSGGALRLWTNDPPYADKVGRWRHGPALVERPFASLFGFNRASKAWDFDSTGALTEVEADNLRVGYSAPGVPAGILMEGVGSNLCSNPRGEGAALGVIGSGGSLPTSWGVSNAVQIEVVGFGQVNGLPYVDLRFSGVPSTTAGQALTHVVANGTAGDVITDSLYVALIAGSFANVNGFTFRVANELTGTNFAPDATYSRRSATIATTTVGRTPTLRWNYFNTTDPVSFTLRVGGWQCEVSPFPTSLTLPPIGAPGVSTFAREWLRIDGAPFQALDVAREGSLIVEWQADALGDGMTRIVAGLADPSGTSRIEFRPAQAGSPFVAVPTGGTGVANLTLSSVTYGVPQRFAARWGPAGIAMATNGSGVQSNSFRPNAAFSVLGIGANHAGFAHLFGRIRKVQVLNYAAPNAELTARSVVGA